MIRVTGQESNLIFSSLQIHLNKINGEQMPIVDINIRDAITGRSLPLALSERQKQAMRCSTERCHERAFYFANLTGVEVLFCERHGREFRTHHHAEDASTWFCRELQPDKGPDAMWYVAWKVPPELRDSYGLLMWLWYPMPDPADGGETTLFSIYREKDETLQLPEGARWERITMDEIAHLMGQLIYETQRGHPPFVVGFAPDHPYDRPDPSLGYSVAKHSCEECSNDMAEPFCFNYKKITGDMRDIQQAHIIQYKPERGTIRCIRQ